MNENLNLVEILKDCPRGTKLYSTVFGDVKFNCVKEQKEYPIRVLLKNGPEVGFTSKGTEYTEYKGECVLFPRKDQRDWSKFNDGIKAADAEPNLEILWHDACKEPQDNYIVLCDGLDNLQWVENCQHIDIYYANWQNYVEAFKVNRWAYIKDLLPKGGDDENR